MRARSHKYQNEDAEYVDTTHYDKNTHNLDIGYQRLKKINIKSHPELGNIRSLFIDHNNLTELPSPEHMPHLVELSCSNNKLTHIPLYPKLEFLNISHNRITTLDIYHGSKLDYIDCSFNMGFVFTPKLKRCTQLYINDTSLREINLSLLPMLELLDCSNNKLSTIGKHDALLELNIQYNSILDLPIYPKLRILMADNNLMTKLRSYPVLYSVTASYNNLSSVDSQPKLKKLIATHNTIEKINDLPLLKLMDLSHNKIKEISLSDKIQYASIHFNPIDHLKLGQNVMNTIRELQISFKVYLTIYDTYHKFFKSINIKVSLEKLNDKLQKLNDIFEEKLIEHIKKYFLKIKFQDRIGMFFRIALYLYRKHFADQKSDNIKDLIQSHEFIYLLENIANLYYSTIIVTIFFENYR